MRKRRLADADTFLGVMMGFIEYVEGDIFESGCQTLVNPINCVGAMGKGLAQAFKVQYPHMYKDYMKKAELRKIKVGYPYMFRHLDYEEQILMFPTKDHWNYPSKLTWIDQGLQNVVLNFKHWRIETLALPALGCGEGGLKFDHVQELIENTIGQATINVPRRVVVYLPKE
jgi:O-acetyl-ADP-ribose deacetylase (regulator of RNase III)